MGRKPETLEKPAMTTTGMIAWTIFIWGLWEARKEDIENERRRLLRFPGY